MSRVDDMPVYEQQKVEIEARLFNLWLRSKHSIAYPIRFPLSGLRGLVMIMQEGEWLCADETQYDLPVICWIDFQDKGRDTLHTPVACTRNFYHFAAEKIAPQVLELLQLELQQRLDK